MERDPAKGFWIVRKIAIGALNQAIQIQDGFSFVVEQNAICIDALVMVELIKCYITLNQYDAKTFYQEFQFDIEDKLTELLSDLDGQLQGALRCTEQDILNH
jgi:hypothetical protein